VVFFLDTARESFDLLLSIGAGTGLIYLLRWFWWRVNAWSEIAAMTSSFAISLGLFIAQKNGAAIPPHISLIASVAVTSVVWILVTFLTRPADRATLENFYRLVRPFGRGWEDIRRSTGVSASADSLPSCLLGWALGCTLVYSALFGTGNFLYGRNAQALVCLAPFCVSLAGLIWLLPRIFKDNGRGSI
jgi:hypothetical protein